MEFYGAAKTLTGDVWWHEEPLSDGTIKRHVLMPAGPVAVVEQPSVGAKDGA